MIAKRGEHRTRDGGIAVLVVEAEPTQAERLRSRLAENGYDVTVAANGVEALAAARRRTPAVVISAIVMPAMDGYSLCKAIKADHQLKETPVVLLTPLANSLDLVRGLQCGVDNFLWQPYDDAYLMKRLRSLLANRELRDRETMRIGVQVELGGQTHLITAERQQILDLLISTHEQAVRVTDELQARERALRESELLFRGVFHSQTDAVVVVTPERTVVDLNPAAAVMFGYSPEELRGRSTEVLHVDHEHYVRFGEIMHDAFARREAARFEFELRRKDGEVFPAENTISSLEDDLGRPVGIVSVVRDITERQRAEEKYRGIFENAVVGIFQTTLEGRYVTANPTLARIYGYESPQELLASVSDLNRRFYVQPGRREEFIRLVEARGAVREFESQVFHKDGRVIWISEDARAVRDAGGTLLGFEGTSVDITARKLAEEDRERFVAILEATTDFVAIADPQSRLLYLNRAGRKLLGIGPDENLASRRVGQGQPEWARKLVVETAIPAVVRDGAWKGETAFLDADGREVPFSQVVLAHRRPDGQVAFFSTIARDLSDQKSLEEQLRQAQKMEAIGQLAGGVAHDFNNILGVVTGYADILLLRLPQGDPLRRHTQEIAKAATRAAGLTRQLLAFSRKQALNPRPLDLNATVDGMEGMLRRLIGEDVDLVTVLAPDLPPVMADPGQVEQVLLNLAGNARDAMPEGGRLTIETAGVHLGEAYARSHVDVRPGAYTMLALSDTGHGMDKATQARIFEPFFTTKEVGKGTGLGLSTVYGIVKQSGGDIEVYSELGAGTTFKVYLPQVGETAEAEAAAGVAPAAAPGGSETVLVVEDEESLRDVIREILEENGYAVLVAADGAEALPVAEACAGPIHLLLTDVVMPRLSGRELFERLSALRPELRCVFMSGYTGHAALRNGTLPEGQGFLGKPFTTESLLRKVREALDAPS